MRAAPKRMSIVIRSAETGDIDALAALSKRTIRARYPSFLGQEAVESYLASGAVDSYFRDHVACCFVIEADGVVAGVGAFKGLKVDLMMIDLERQGRGLGTRLLDHLEALLFERSAEITLESFARNDLANEFYRNRGWAPVESYIDSEMAIPMIRLRKIRP